MLVVSVSPGNRDGKNVSCVLLVIVPPVIGEAVLPSPTCSPPLVSAGKLTPPSEIKAPDLLITVTVLPVLLASVIAVT